VVGLLERTAYERTLAVADTVLRETGAESVLELAAQELFLSEAYTEAECFLRNLDRHFPA
jgi:hypothetical protein